MQKVRWAKRFFRVCYKWWKILHRENYQRIKRMAKTKGMNTRLHHRLYDKIIYRKVKAEVPATSIPILAPKRNMATTVILCKQTIRLWWWLRGDSCRGEAAEIKLTSTAHWRLVFHARAAGRNEELLTWEISIDIFSSLISYVDKKKKFSIILG